MKRLLAELMAEKTFEPFEVVMDGDRFQVLSFENAVWREDYITVLHPRSNRKDNLRLSSITIVVVLDQNELPSVTGE